MTSKATNPKDAVGTRKLPFSVLPWQVLCRVALAMLEGAAKYGRHNYRGAGVRASVYFDAVVARHLTQWWEGEDVDADSGEHHVDKAIAGLMVMRDSMLQGNFTDDRPPRGRGVNMADLNARAATLIDKHADKQPKHWVITDAMVDDVLKTTNAVVRGVDLYTGKPIYEEVDTGSSYPYASPGSTIARACNAQRVQNQPYLFPKGVGPNIPFTCYCGDDPVRGECE